MAKKEKDRVTASHKANVRRQNILGYLFLAPWLVGFLVFTLWPFLFTIYLSFSNVKSTVLGWEITPAGLANYDIALFRNTVFTPSLISFLVMEITYVPTILVLSFILALLLNRGIKGRTVFRTLYFLPVIVMSGPVMYQLMDTKSTSTINLSNVLVFKIVSNYFPSFADAIVYLFQNFSLVLWFTGIPIVLFINGLQKINTSVIEAATIDSATSWQILWKITMPIIRPIALLVAIFTIIQLGLYSVNPVFKIITDAIANSNSGMGIASVYAWVYSAVMLLLIGLVFLALNPPKEVVAKEVKRLEKRWNER